ncbi:Signal transduction histidine kinase [Plantibacter sp. VKM Ac-1784]|uniref:Oxygen sensor histidine kinase NreB n=1 Tax=Plantibacter elymi (nom. nud.) TaxID=199708 RepID=A0ABY1RH98_9MICO|nr:sensor histidine kinase [Plantibacter sp. VKM Ac-1784]SMQ73933.1 Signal transduction histidine kinase [Plantibacter sp. VKM Ac-1784]
MSDARTSAQPTPDSRPYRRAAALGATPLDVVLNLTFFALLVTSAVRYVMSHGVEAVNWTVAALTVATAAAYLLATRKTGVRHRILVVILLALWTLLVLIAPSFWWTAFSVYFLARRAFPTAWIAVGLAAVCARSLLVLTGGFDWTIVVGTAVVAALVSVVTSRIESDNRTQAALIRRLTEAQERLAATERQAGIAQERARVSSELHDSVTQGLASSLLIMEATAQTIDTSPATSRARLREAVELIRSTLGEARNLVHDLGSPRLDGISLASALGHLVAETPSAQLRIDGEPRPYPPEIAHAILRVCQSAVQNADHHAGASAIHVTLSCLADQVVVDIADDGVGFDASAVPEPSSTGGYGLRAMRQRIEQLGGRFTVESAPGDGTVIVAQLPTDAGSTC